MIEITTGFKPRQAVETTGIQAQVIFGDFDGVSAIKKVFGTDLSDTQKEQMVWAMRVFRDQLSKENVSIPDNFLVEATEQGIESVDEVVLGEDLDVQLKTGQSLEPWVEVVSLLCNLNDGSHKSRLLLDAKPANWIVDSKPYFIDFFPPTLRDIDGQLYPYFPHIYKRDRELFTFNYGDTRGQLTKLLAGARLTYPERYQELAEVTLQTARPKLHRGTFKYIDDQVSNSFPDMSLFYKSPHLIKEKLATLGDSND